MKRKISLEEAYRYCQDVARRNDTNFYLGFQFLPKDKRNAVFACYAFCRYVDDIADELGPGAKVEELLDRWERDLDACYAGKADHPITIALADAVKRYGIPKAPFKGLIEGCRMDQRIKRYATFRDLLKYCNRVATTISTISLSIFGYKNKNAKKYGRYLSLALQLTNILRDVGEDARRGRIYLPLEELKRFGYSEAELLRGEINDNFKRLMRFQIERVRKYYAKAFEVTKLVSEDSRLATLLMGATYAKVLEQIERNGFDVFNKKAKLSFWQKLWLVLKMRFSPSYVSV
ncbi:MAG: presqualene diphosphate synthase HpnD [Candidatus Micrarchaeia archaeon]